jgi:hypothetical protein
VAKKSMIPGGGGYVVKDERGMRELLLSQGVADLLADRMARVQIALPGSKLYVTRGPRGGKRARAVVSRGSDFEEANTGELSRALDLAGGKRGYKKRTNKPKARKSAD